MNLSPISIMNRWVKIRFWNFDDKQLCGYRIRLEPENMMKGFILIFILLLMLSCSKDSAQNSEIPPDGLEQAVKEHIAVNHADFKYIGISFDPRKTENEYAVTADVEIPQKIPGLPVIKRGNVSYLVKQGVKNGQKYWQVTELYSR